MFKYVVFGTFAFTVLTYLKLMATKETLLAILDRISAAQTDLAGDIRDLKTQLENAGVDQEIIDKAESIAASLETLANETPGETKEPETPEEPVA